MNKQKLLAKVLAGPHNSSFRDVQQPLLVFGFKLERTSGSHHIYSHPDITEIINLQSVNGKAKAYQVRQMLRIIENKDLRL